MPAVFAHLQYTLGRVFSPVRGHDAKQIIFCRALRDIAQPNMTLEAPECGPSGSSLLIEHTRDGPDGRGVLPELHWTAPPGQDQNVCEYVLVCEDIDLPIPCSVFTHGLFYGIPHSVNTARSADVKIAATNQPKVNNTAAGWKYVPTPGFQKSSYIGAAPPLGHGKHRYVFTIIALDHPLVFLQGETVTKEKVKKAMLGKVIGWGQWIGVCERTLPK